MSTPLPTITSTSPIAGAMPSWEIKQERANRFKTLIANGMAIADALRELGFAESIASKGRANLPLYLQQALDDVDREQYIELGRRVTPSEQEAFVRGRALKAAQQGSDKGAQMLKLLGSDKRVNMFVADSQIGVIVVGEMPAALASLASIARELPPVPDTIPSTEDENP